MAPRLSALRSLLFPEIGHNGGGIWFGLPAYTGDDLSINHSTVVRPLRLAGCSVCTATRPRREAGSACRGSRIRRGSVGQPPGELPAFISSRTATPGSGLGLKGEPPKANKYDTPTRGGRKREDLCLENGQTWEQWIPSPPHLLIHK